MGKRGKIGGTSLGTTDGSRPRTPGDRPENTTPHHDTTRQNDRNNRQSMRAIIGTRLRAAAPQARLRPQTKQYGSLD